MVLLRLLANSDRQRFQHQVVCLFNGDGAVARQITRLGIPVTDLGMSTRWRLDAFFRLFLLLRRVKPDILHTWMFHANVPGRVLGRSVGIPHIISSEHTLGVERRWRRALNRLTSPLADRIICISHSVADYAEKVIGLPASKLVVIPNGVDLAEFRDIPPQNEARQALGLQEQAQWIGAVGRPRPVKGYPDLLEAFSRLAVSHPQARLLFVGDGPDRPQLQAQAQAAGLAARVVFYTDQAEIPQVMAALDLLAVPSLQEGLSLVALEAMAARRPVVATAVGGLPEVVLYNVTGLLVPPSQPDALALAIARLLDDADLRQRLGQAGWERVSAHYTLAQNVARTEALYLVLSARE